MLHHDFESEEKFQEMADLSTLSITELIWCIIEDLPFLSFLQVRSGKRKSCTKEKKKKRSKYIKESYLKNMKP